MSDRLEQAFEGPFPRLPAWIWEPWVRRSSYRLSSYAAGRRFGLFDDLSSALELTEELIAGVPEHVDVSCEWAMRGKSLVFECVGSGVKLKRSFYREDDCLFVCHDYFELDPVHRNQGHAGKMLRSSLHSYDRIGVERVYVHANIDVGGYAWAKAGFVLRPDTFDDTFAILGEILEELTTERRVLMLQVLEDSPSARMMYDLSTLRDDDGPFGRQMLLGSDWFGYVDLRNPEHRALLNEATGQ